MSFPAASWIEKQLVLLIDVLITLGRVTTVVTVPKPDKAANGQQLITSSSPRSQPVAIITKWVPMSLLRSSRKSCADDHLQSFNAVYGACDLHLLEKTMFKAFTQTWLCHVLPTELGLLKQQWKDSQAAGIELSVRNKYNHTFRTN